MLIDNALMIWPKFNLDYSTHTALALALVSVFYLSRWQSELARHGFTVALLCFDGVSKISYSVGYFANGTGGLSALFCRTSLDIASF